MRHGAAGETMLAMCYWRTPGGAESCVCAPLCLAARPGRAEQHSPVHNCHVVHQGGARNPGAGSIAYRPPAALLCLQLAQYPTLATPERAPSIFERVFMLGDVLAGNSCPANSTKPANK